MKKFTSNILDKKNILPIIMTCAGIVIIIFCVFIFLPGDKTSEDKFGLKVQELKDQISILEKRISVLEEQDNSRMTQISALSEMARGFNESSKRLQAVPGEMENIQKKIDHIDQRQGNLEKRIAEFKTSRTTRVTKPAVAKTQTRQAVSAKNTNKYHKIVEGDTLYSIANKYGLTVDKLRQLNKLSPEAYIQPGQNLIIDN